MRARRREQNLRELRRMADWTQAKTSRATGIDRAILSQIETGEVKGKAVTVARIRRLLIKAIAKRAARIERVLTSAAGSEPQGRSGNSRLQSANV
jgi:transcriptional regulator with XRE-family HTH domain